MSTTALLQELGYIQTSTPKGRQIWVNPEFYPLSAEDLADHDNYMDWTDTQDDRYDDWSDLGNGDY